MGREDILHTLRRDVEAAREMLASVIEELDAILRESSSELPRPDGTQRFHSAAEALSVARKALESFARSAFEGIDEDNLKKGAGR
jgi:hypothetical protein